METIHNADLLTRRIKGYKKESKTIGFVPTMGALHKGHLSLLHFCKSQNDISVLSIFVNPTQFDDAGDLKNYPRTLEKDLDLLRKEHCNIVFCPDEKEIYPEVDRRMFDLGGLDRTMEGLYRQGHFNGVAQVISRFLEIIMPHRIYMGLKDYQQLVIIRKIVNDLGYPVEVVACPTIREDDGLAMSSRNVLLNAEQRIIASSIARTLNEAKERIATHNIKEIKEFVINRLNSNPFLDVEYFEIVDENTLKPAVTLTGDVRKVGCIAVKVGSVRLIDNIYFSS